MCILTYMFKDMHINVYMYIYEYIYLKYTLW